MFLHLLCGSYFPVKGQEVIEMRIERNSWLMSSWLYHPSFLLCLFSSFWHLGKTRCFHYDQIFRQTVVGSPLVQTVGKENKVRKHKLWSLQKALSDFWDLLFFAIPARNTPILFLFLVRGQIIPSPFFQSPFHIQWFLLDKICSVIKKCAKPQPLENESAVPTKKRIGFWTPPKTNRKHYPPDFAHLMLILDVILWLSSAVLSWTNFPESQI